MNKYIIFLAFLLSIGLHVYASRLVETNKFNSFSKAPSETEQTDVRHSVNFQSEVARFSKLFGETPALIFEDGYTFELSQDSPQQIDLLNTILGYWIRESIILSDKQIAYLIALFLYSHDETELNGTAMILEKYQTQEDIKRIIQYSSQLDNETRKLFIKYFSHNMFLGWTENQFEKIEEHYGIYGVQYDEYPIIWPEFKQAHPEIVDVFEKEGLCLSDFIYTK